MCVRVMCVYIKPKGVDETRAKVVLYFSFFKEGRKRCFLFRVVKRFSTFFSLFFVILILNICYKKVRYKKKRIKDEDSRYI